MGITCDNASANDAMVETLATIMADFPGEANRSRCLAHIVNLVVKIILRQFDVKKKKKNSPELNGEGDGDGEHDVNEPEPDEDDEESEEVLDKEEKEMDDGEEDVEDDGERLERDVDNVEDAMEEEIKEVSNQVKPVRQVLFKVNCSSFFYYLFSLPFLFSIRTLR